MKANLRKIQERKNKKQQTDIGIKLYTVGAKRMLLKVVHSAF